MCGVIYLQVDMANEEAHIIYSCCPVNSGGIGFYELFQFIILVLHCCLVQHLYSYKDIRFVVLFSHVHTQWNCHFPVSFVFGNLAWVIHRCISFCFKSTVWYLVELATQCHANELGKLKLRSLLPFVCFVKDIQILWERQPTLLSLNKQSWGRMYRWLGLLVLTRAVCSGPPWQFFPCCHRNQIKCQRANLLWELLP